MKHNIPDILHPEYLWYLVEVGNNKSASYRQVFRIQGLAKAKDYALTETKTFKVRVKEEATGNVVWRSF